MSKSHDEEADVPDGADPKDETLSVQSDPNDPPHLTREEEEDLTDAERDPQQVIYSGQDFDVAGLVGRLERGDILIPSYGHNDGRIISRGFQRAFVWSKRQMDRFIESLLLGYPIPGIFLVRQSDKRYLVLDGQQRLSTLRGFVGGIHDGKEFSLKNTADRFLGLTYKTLPEDLRRLFDDTFVQATIVKSDGTPSSLESIYNIFERLNSGGTQLTPHEIRVALYAGELVDFIEELNSLADWRGLYGRRSTRLRDQELALRVVALYCASTTYARPLKTFLNRFAGEHRDLKKLNQLVVAETFSTATTLLNSGAGAAAFRFDSRQVNTALAEATMVGLMRRLDAGTLPDAAHVKAASEALRELPRFTAAISRATADEENVRTRLSLATQIFQGT